MIDRYCTPTMTAIWIREAKYRKWLEVELAILQSQAEVGLVPMDDLDVVQSRASFDIARCDELERETRHDLMAFVRNVAETVGEAGRWLHFGVTSYDVIDTALGMMLRDTCDALIASVGALRQEVARLAREHVDTPMMGRTHGIHAEPITFGFKLANWYAELSRTEGRLGQARAEVAVGKLSGPVGIHAHNSPDLEARVCEILGLAPDPASTQIVSRDRHAHFLNVLALLGGTMERIATELRNLQRTEIYEVQEAFAAGQTGSSAMPHKRNPWNSETVCGLARVLRGNAHAMLESVATWHERDLTNSSVERVVLPDSCQIADFITTRLTAILAGLTVLPENMKANMSKFGELAFSEGVMVALVAKGMSRDAAYKVAQRNAAKAWDGADYRSSVAADPDVASTLTEEEIARIFDLEHHLRHARYTLKAVGID
jgi:adenylosuccinate lyase